MKSKYFLIKTLNNESKLAKTSDEMSEEEILRTVRAFDFPGYEPAYMMVNGKKIYLRMS